MNDDLTLRQIFDDPILLEGFVQFCKVQHCSENLLFYNAATAFKEVAEDAARAQDLGKKVEAESIALTSSPGGGGSSRSFSKGKSLSKFFAGMSFSSKNEPKADDLVKRASAHRKSVSSGAVPPPAPLSPQSARNLGGVTNDEEVLKLASKIYFDFLTEESESWVCISLDIAARIKVKIETLTALPAGLFDEAQKQVFANLESDVLPRYLKSFNTTTTSSAAASGGAGATATSPAIMGKKTTAVDEVAVNGGGDGVRGSVRFNPDTKLRDQLAALKAAKKT